MTPRRKARIILVGSPRVGKTAYVTVLFRELNEDGGLPWEFAPNTNTASRVLGSSTELSRGRWIAATPLDYLYLYTARVTSRPPFGSGLPEVELEVADVAGEQINEFVPGERQYTDKTAFYQYTLESDGLFFFIDYPAVDPDYGPPARPLSTQVNDLIFVIQGVAEASGIGSSERLDVPVAIIITKLDVVMKDFTPDETPGTQESSFAQRADYLAQRARKLSGVMDELPSVLEQFPDPDRKAELRRLVAVARARCKWVGIFAVSSVGPLDLSVNSNHQLSPVNVTAPLEWMLETRPANVGKRVRARKV